MAIVVGTDLSESSLEGLRAAFAIAQKRGDEEIFLVHVLPDESIEDGGGALADAAKKRLDADAAKLATGTPIKVRSEVLLGGGEGALMAFAETEQAELLIVTSQGGGNEDGGRPMSLRKLGTSAERLAVRATVPLLVVRDASALMAWAVGERRLRVLVGVDESAACEGAISIVKALRRVGAIDIVVGHVYFPDEAAKRYGLRNVNMVEATPELEKLLVRDLTRRLGTVPGEGEITIAPRLGLGRVGDHMLETADAQKVDLIVVGTHRKAGLKRLSSVSAVILHDAHQSVLCVPLSADTALDDVPTIRVAVAATDRSAFGNRAVPYAYALVGHRGEVHIVHIVDEENDVADQDVIDELLEMAPPSRMSVTTRAHVVHGDDPARTIAETAERLGADVVVIASHGRSGISRALVGSVADKLMRACHRPVLVLRPVEVIAPGTVFAAPVHDGRWTAYQVVSDDGKSPAIVALDVLEDTPPTLALVREAGLLHVDHHNWNGRCEYLHVTPAKPPARWRELGVLPVPKLGKCNSHGGWPDGFAQIVLQRRWETEIPEAARAAYKAATRGPARIDLGGLVVEISRMRPGVALGTHDAPLARDLALRWEALDELAHLTKLDVHGDPAGLVEYLRARPMISDLGWWEHGRDRVDLSTTRLLELSTGADAPVELLLPDTVTSLRLRGAVDEITVAQPLAGARLHLALGGKPLRLPRGLAKLRGLAVASVGTLDLATIANAYPALETLEVRGDATELVNIEELARLKRLRALTFYACYQLDAAKLPPASTWPELDRVTIDGHRKIDAAALKSAMKAAPRFELRGGKTDTWLAANLDNPFRDWIDRDAALGKKACTAWRKARAAKQLDEKVLRAFIDVFNKLDAKHHLDTIDREEVGEAFFALAALAELDPKKAEKWFDAWRDF